MDCADGCPPAWTAFVAERRSSDGTQHEAEAVASEVPVALAYNGISHAVMLATPCDLEDFGIGFSLCEGIVRSYAEIHDVETCAGADGITVDLRIGQAAFARLKERRRNLAGRTGCGLCGTESLAQVLRPLPRVESDVCIEERAVHASAGALLGRQPLHAATGAVHAAAWCRADGSIAMAREDVGRHNALDKLAGAMVRQRMPLTNGFVLLTSRASSEMVQKAATVGIPLLAAVSAPTGLAIRLAEQCGLTLVAWVRAGRLAVFAHGGRIRSGSMEPVA